MKRLLAFACLITILGGCAVVPVGYPVHETVYREYPGYGYDDGYRWHGRRGGPRWRYGNYRR
jgi:hypothetical protein